MPNILLPPYRFRKSDFQFSADPGDRFRKIIFQCQFRDFPDGDIEMEIIGYPAWRRGNNPRDRWTFGIKVTGDKLADAERTNLNETVPHNPDDPLALGNNETPVWIWHPIKDAAQHKQDEISMQLNIIFSEENTKEIEFDMKTRIYEKNLHTYYEVYFSDGTATTTNPCPPNQPGE